MGWLAGFNAQAGVAALFFLYRSGDPLGPCAPCWDGSQPPRQRPICDGDVGVHGGCGLSLGKRADWPYDRRAQWRLCPLWRWLPGRGSPGSSPGPALERRYRLSNYEPKRFDPSISQLRAWGVDCLLSIIQFLDLRSAGSEQGLPPCALAPSCWTSKRVWSQP